MRKQATSFASGRLEPATQPAAGPEVLTARRTRRATAQGTLLFRPYSVQRGVGPHLDATYGYASDAKWDAFHSNLHQTDAGLVLSDTEGQERFGINVRWNVEGFGFGYITADAGGQFYELPPKGETRTFNLNAELARSRLMRNRRRMQRHTQNGWQPSRALQTYLALSEGYFEDAEKTQGGEEERAALAQQALYYALWAGERMELEKARDEIRRRGRRPNFFFGIDAKAFYLMSPERFMDRFNELFNFANVTFVPRDRTMGDFEPAEGRVQYDRHDVVVDRLRKHDVAVGGRLLFWFHRCCTPDWIKQKSYDELKRYVERHTREVVGHYGDRIYAWELMNELHDWANEVALTPEQTVELTALACDVARDTNPNVHRLINNCCPFAEYVQMGEWSGQRARYPQRTPWEFTRDLVDAGVDFTRLGQQMYFPWRDLQDAILLVERFEAFEKPLQLSEVGVTSGPSNRSVRLGEAKVPDRPYVWHRPWDEELQAEWLEGLYTLAYSHPWIEAANWFDFVDYPAYIDNGGLLRSPRGERKAAYHRLKKLQEEWNTPPQEPADDVG